VLPGVEENYFSFMGLELLNFGHKIIKQTGGICQLYQRN
jgi:hypothetical protein